jgi:uncharacterized membrane protein required for colicin V production
MLFWVCLIIGGVFAWLGLKKGLYVWLATLFSLMAGIYIGVLATPRVLNMNSEYSDSGYYAATTMLMLAMVVFAVLEAICWFSFLHDREEYFPKLIEQVGGGVCGFLFGYFLLCLVTLAVCVMPFSRGKMPFLLPQRESMAKFSGKPVVGICNFIGEYSLECFDGEPQAVVESLLTVGENKKEPTPDSKEPAADGTT